MNILRNSLEILKSLILRLKILNSFLTMKIFKKIYHV